MTVFLRRYLVIPAASALIFSAFAGSLALVDRLWVNPNGDYHSDGVGVTAYYYPAIIEYAVPLFLSLFGAVLPLTLTTNFFWQRFFFGYSKLASAVLLPLFDASIFSLIFAFAGSHGGGAAALLLYCTPLFLIEIAIRSVAGLFQGAKSHAATST